LEIGDWRLEMATSLEELRVLREAESVADAMYTTDATSSTPDPLFTETELEWLETVPNL
jgi:hypothetical protein